MPAWPVGPMILPVVPPWHRGAREADRGRGDWGRLLGAQSRKELPGLPGGRPVLGRRPGPRARGQGGRAPQDRPGDRRPRGGKRRARAVGPRSTVRVTDDVGAVLSDDRVDAVAVATPAWTHFEVALACLEAGKHVLVEKPFASSVAEGEKLVATAARSGLVLMCDHTYCYTPAVRKLGELLGSGALGDLQYFDSVRINLGLVQPDVD